MVACLRSGSQQRLARAALVHRAIALRHQIERQRQIGAVAVTAFNAGR
jgi:hypothetical protein